MKKYSYIVILVCLFSITGCSDSFLDLSPENETTTNVFYSNEEDFKLALAGAYGTLLTTNFGDNLPILFDIRADNAFSTRARGNFFNILTFSAGSTNTNLSNFYTINYQSIQAANAIIDRIGDIEFNEVSERDRIIAEAMFIRSLSYFYLTQAFGAVPLVLEEATSSNLTEIQSISRTPVDQVYNQIIQDMDEAAQLYTEFDIPNRASLQSFNALKGLVLMQGGEYAQAAVELEKVIGNFELLPTFSDLFFGSANNPEAIFVLEFIGGADNTGSGIGFQFRPTGNFGGFNIANLGIYMEKNLFDAYTPEDSARREISARPVDGSMEEAGTDVIYLNSKYNGPQPPFDLGNGSNNNYIFRYGDILLLYAEALNEVAYGTTASFAALNQVRERAGLQVLSSADLPDQESFRTAVIEERRLELAGEGKRWIDLKRKANDGSINVVDLMNNYLDTAELAIEIDVTFDEDNFVYAIPLEEVLNNPEVIDQNPGY